jgi:hypothetical protein
MMCNVAAADIIVDFEAKSKAAEGVDGVESRKGNRERREGRRKILPQNPGQRS